MASTLRRVEETGEVEIVIRFLPRDGAGMRELEEQLQEELHGAGNVASGDLLKRFDTDGSPLERDGLKYTSKGLQNKSYQTPYGVVDVERHVYQSMYGGATFCPLEADARIIGATTPKFAAMAGWKYAMMASSAAQSDLARNHGREVSRCYLQDIAAAVAAVAHEKEGAWTYADPVPEAEVHTVGLSIDGTTMLFCQGGYREAMVGTLSLYDAGGERLHTTYVGAEPEYGKATFFARMDKEVAELKGRYPAARWVGVADGASQYWPWLRRHVDTEVLDFYHATGYLASAAPALCPGRSGRKGWIEEECHKLKHEDGAAASLLARMERAPGERRLGKKVEEDLRKAITYFQNHHSQMDYAGYRRRNLPIGSGIVEAGCKELVKARMCGSGMKWKVDGASVVIALRSLVLTESRWDQFWQKIDRYGFSS